MTPSELKLAALRELKVISAGQDADPDDFALMGEKYTALHAMLLTDELVTWAITEDVPAKAQEPVKMMLAAFAAGDFGVPEPRLGQLMTLGGFNLPQTSLAERQLRKALASKYVSHSLRTTYY